jgi:hypothetical protein
MSIAFPLGAKVRFTQKRLSILTPRDRQGLAGRIGMTQTDSSLMRKPTVSFPADGTNQELRLFRVDPSHLELLESLPNTDITPDHNDGGNLSDLTDCNADVVTTVSDGGDHLSQSEMDNLFA